MHNLNLKPAVFWFLNADFDADELRYQLREMYKHGIGGVYMHWIIGGPGYMSETWLQALDVIIDESAKLGMDAWLYDEAWCPSCYAGGRVLAERPDLQAKTLWSEQLDVASGDKAILNFDLMKVLSAVALPLKDGIPQLDKSIDISSYLGSRAEELDKPYRHDYGYYPFIEPHLHWRASMKGKMRWQLEWEAPEGNDWRVYIFCQREMLQWDNFNRLDVLNPESIQYFLKETHEKYAKRYSNHFGKTIPGMMTDEYKFLPGAWTEQLPEHYEKRYNINLLKLLPAMVDDSIGESKVVKANYHRLISDLFIENYTLPMKAWCKQHNLILTGHISPEENGSVEIKFAGNIAGHIKHFDMPGADIIIPYIGDREHPVLNLSPRLATSVAHQQGVSKVFIEAGACGNENLSIEDLKYLFDWLMVHGINYFVIHGFTYSLTGYGKFLAGQSMDAYGNLLPHFQALSNYIEEQSEILTEFRPNAKVAILKPMAALRASCGIYESENEGDFIDKALTEISMTLIENHIDFDLVDEDDAANWKVKENSLVVGKASYNMVIIPKCNLVTEAAYQKVADFAKNGGYTIAHKTMPNIISSTEISKCEKSSFILLQESNEIAKFAKDNVSDRIKISGNNRDYVQVFKGFNSSGEKLCFMLNTNDSPVDLLLESDGDTIAVNLESHESKIIKLPFANSAKSEKAKQIVPINLDSPFKLKVEKQNHFPVTAGMEIIIEDGVGVDSLICDKENLDLLKKIFTINQGPRCKHREDRRSTTIGSAIEKAHPQDGKIEEASLLAIKPTCGNKKSPEWEKANDVNFYTPGNLSIPVKELFKFGTNKHNWISNRNIKSENYAHNAQKDIPKKNALVHIVDFDNETMPTLLLSGDFSVFINDTNQVVLKRVPTESNSVSRIETGFPYLRGELIFETTFSLDKSIKNGELHLKNRTGSIEVLIDGDSKGIVAWQPNAIKIGDISEGNHTVTLKAIGDGIGILHEGHFEAGCRELELLNPK